MKALRMQEICLLVTSFFALLPTSSAVTSYVGTCHNPSYSTISAAVDAVAPGATIKVCPGTYPEQVFITKGLTLEGISSGNTGRVVVSVPLSSSGGPNWQFVPDPNGSATMVAPMIYVNNPGADVTIKDMATDSTADVNAPACGAPGSYWITAVFLSQINQLGIHNRFSDLGPAGNSWNTSQPGCQVGIWSVLPPSATNSGTQLTITNSAILSNYQGIYIECQPCLAGQTVNVNISGNTLNVSGAGILYQGISGKIASNTVQTNSAPVGTQQGPNQGVVDVGGLPSDPSLTIAGNTLTKNPGPQGSATGIDLSLAPVVPIISTNKISGFDTGIALPSGATSGTVKGNFISITSITAINVNCSNPAAFTITGNTVNGTASAVSGAPIGYALSGITAYNADQLIQSCPGVNRKATTQ